MEADDYLSKQLATIAAVAKSMPTVVVLYDAILYSKEDR